MSPPLTVMIADDHPLFRKGLADVLRTDISVELVGEASDGPTALAMIEQRQPRVAVLDVGMPGMSGLDIARRVRELRLEVGIILLTMHDEREILDRALDLGVSGYVLKESAAADLLSCIHYVAEGRTYISPALSQHLVRRRARIAVHEDDALASLTPAEMRVLALIARSRTSPQIAAELGIRRKTVDNHRSSICKKLGLTGSNALVRFALEHRQTLGEGRVPAPGGRALT